MTYNNFICYSQNRSKERETNKKSSSAYPIEQSALIIYQKESKTILFFKSQPQLSLASLYKMPLIFKMEQYDPDSRISSISSELDWGSFLQITRAQVVWRPDMKLAEHLPWSNLISKEGLRGDKLFGIKEKACVLRMERHVSNLEKRED